MVAMFGARLFQHWDAIFIDDVDLIILEISYPCIYRISWKIYDESGVLGGGFKYFLFSPLLGDMIQFD